MRTADPTDGGVGSYHPLVSIVIPVFNGGDYMRDAIDSALSQTYENVEVLVVNDGSCDDGETDRIARSYGDAIRYFTKTNGGCASALNLGLDMMQGEWFSWLSHDDVYRATKVESALGQVAANGLDPDRTVISCGSVLVDANGRRLRKTRGLPRGLTDSSRMAEWLIAGHGLNGCSLLISRGAMSRVGHFNTNHVYILDWEYWLALAISGQSFFSYPESLVLSRRHKDQVSVRAAHRHLEELREFFSYFVQDLPEGAAANVPLLAAAWVGCRRAGALEQCDIIEERLSRLGVTIPITHRIRGHVASLVRAVKAVIRKDLHRGV